MDKLQTVNIPFLTEDERMAVIMIAEGQSHRDVADFLELSPAALTKILNKPQVKDVLSDHLKRIVTQRILPKAIHTYDHILSDPTVPSAVKLAAATKIAESEKIIEKPSVAAGQDNRVGMYVNNANITVGGTGEQSKQQLDEIERQLVARQRQLERGVDE